MTWTSRSVSLNLEHHADLVAWWDSQENASLVVREILRAYIAGRPVNASGFPGHQAGPGQGGPDLAEFRQVIEAVLDERLAGLALASGPAPAQPEDEDVLDPFDELLA